MHHQQNPCFETALEHRIEWNLCQSGSGMSFLPFSVNPRSIKLFGVSGRNIPPTVIKRAGTAAKPRDSLQPHGLIFCVPKFIILAGRNLEENHPWNPPHRVEKSWLLLIRNLPEGVSDVMNMNGMDKEH
ncbi:hypothetical protein Lal_00021837 [Lupinus albus]|nr:hypothetical protein Lal_00021837 [Lupinus albus]